ncbi:MAG: DsbA family protein [Pseudomonadota bacterium]
MSNVIDVFWSFRSPYSRLITADLLNLQNDYDVDIQIRPVLPLAIRFPESLFNVDDRRAPRYIAMDSQRRGDMLGRPIIWPSPDPVVQDFKTMTVSSEQPYIYRLTKLGVEASRCDKGLEFIHHVSDLIFGGTPDWDQGDKLKDAAAKAGIDLAELDQAIESGDHMSEIDSNHEALDASGHWGVPTLVFRDEPFFGQDRVDTLRWRLDQSGLSKQT